MLGGPSLEAPVDSVADKWLLLPAFLKVRGLVKQHLDSYNHLVGIEMQQIVKDGEKLKMELEVLEKERGFYQNQFYMFAQGSSNSEDVNQQATLRQHVDQRAAQIGRDIAEKQGSLESMKERYNLLQALAGKLGDFQQDLSTSAQRGREREAKPS